MLEYYMLRIFAVILVVVLVLGVAFSGGTTQPFPLF